MSRVRTRDLRVQVCQDSGFGPSLAAHLLGRGQDICASQALLERADLKTTLIDTPRLVNRAC